MSQAGADALLLLGNSNVSYATGARLAALRSRSGAASTSGRGRHRRRRLPPSLHPVPTIPVCGLRLPADHVHGPVYPEFDEGAEALGRHRSPSLLPRGRGGRWTNSPAPCQGIPRSCFHAGPPSNADDVVGAAKLIKTPDELGFLRLALEITEQAIAPVQAMLAPGDAPDRPHGRVPPGRVRSRGRRQHPRSDLAGHARRAWPTAPGRPMATSPARCSRPSASSPRATCCGSTPASATPDSRRTSAAPGSSAQDPTRAPAGAVPALAATSSTPCSTRPGPAPPGPT